MLRATVQAVDALGASADESVLANIAVHVNDVAGGIVHGSVKSIQSRDWSALAARAEQSRFEFGELSRPVLDVDVARQGRADRDGDGDTAQS